MENKTFRYFISIEKFSKKTPVGSPPGLLISSNKKFNYFVTRRYNADKKISRVDGNCFSSFSPGFDNFNSFSVKCSNSNTFYFKNSKSSKKHEHSIGSRSCFSSSGCSNELERKDSGDKAPNKTSKESHLTANVNNLVDSPNSDSPLSPDDSLGCLTPNSSQAFSSCDTSSAETDATHTLNKSTHTNNFDSVDSVDDCSSHLSSKNDQTIDISILDHQVHLFAGFQPSLYGSKKSLYNRLLKIFRMKLSLFTLRKLCPAIFGNTDFYNDIQSGAKQALFHIFKIINSGNLNELQSCVESNLLDKIKSTNQYLGSHNLRPKIEVSDLSLIKLTNLSIIFGLTRSRSFFERNKDLHFISGCEILSNIRDSDHDDEDNVTGDKELKNMHVGVNDSGNPISNKNKTVVEKEKLEGNFLKNNNETVVDNGKGMAYNMTIENPQDEVSSKQDRQNNSIPIDSASKFINENVTEILENSKNKIPNKIVLLDEEHYKNIIINKIRNRSLINSGDKNPKKETVQKKKSRSMKGVKVSDMMDNILFSMREGCVVIVDVMCHVRQNFTLFKEDDSIYRKNDSEMKMHVLRFEMNLSAASSFLQGESPPLYDPSHWLLTDLNQVLLGNYPVDLRYIRKVNS